MATKVPLSDERFATASADGARDRILDSAPVFAPEDDERLQLVERIASSEAFQKSSRLPVLLRYLAHCTLANNRAGLTEQAIGREVFGKAKDFHPTEDSSVRVYIRQLRLRLHEYFHSVGKGEPIGIEVPKGGYALAFIPQHLAVFEAEPLPHIPVTIPPALAGVPAKQSPHRTAVWLPWLLFAVMSLVALAGWYHQTGSGTSQLPPWPLNQVIEPNRQTTMVLADGSYSLRLLGDQEVTLDQYADHHYADKLIPPDATDGEKRLFGYLRASQITSMADVEAASAISVLAGPLRSQIVIRSAKEMNGNMLTSGNFILIGAKTSNPWTQLYEDRLNFQLVDVGHPGGRSITNRSPLPGEQNAYVQVGITGSSGDDYATISLIPGMGEQGTVLLVQGLRFEGTEAAIRFLSKEENRRSLSEKLKAAHGGTLPPYFEALLHAHSISGSVAAVDCIAVRVVSPIKR